MQSTKVNLVKACSSACGNSSATSFAGRHHEFGKLICDWCAWMFGCDCHAPVTTARHTRAKRHR